MPERKSVKNRQPENPSPGFKFRYVFYTVLVLLFIFSLYSHDADDMAVLEGGSEQVIKNWIGLAGAHFSRIVFYLLGVAAYPVSIVLVISALRPFLSYPLHRRGYTGALLSLCLGITVLFAMYPEEFRMRTDILGIGSSDAPRSALSGGVIGQQLAAPRTAELPPGIVRRYIGTVGTFIVGSVFILVGGFFIFWMDWKTVTVSAVRSFMSRTPPSLLSEAKERMFTMRDSAPEPVKNPDKDVEKERFKPLDEIMINTNCPDSEPEPGKEPEPEDKTESVAGLNNPEPRAGVSVNESVPLPRPLPANSLKTEVAAGEKAKRKFPNNFTLPLVSMLKRHEDNKSVATGWIEESRHILQKTLESFKVDGTVTGIVSGPRVTRFEISLAPGVKVEKVSNITNNIAMELEAKSIRVLAPIPGKNAVGVEVPNAVASSVSLRSMMETRDWKNAGAEIPIILGKDVGGNPIVLDLAKAPHLLIAGATGSGKSVCMNTLIMSLLFKFTPSELRLILVDPKVVELEMYTPLPHLITPVVNDPQKVPLALRWAVNEMEKRYRMMAKVKAKNLAGFNSRPHEPEPVIDDWGNEVPAKLPILVVIVDELADVMMTDAKSDVETSIARIAQKGRAAGVHIVIATQRPSTNIITGVIKANLPTRIAFRVGAIVDSRVILDQKGAETLLGRGDMLFIPPGSANLERIQGAMVDDPDIQKVVEFVSSQADQQFDDKVVSDEPEDESSAPVAPDTVSTSVTSGVDPDIKAMVDKYSEPGDDDNILKSLEILFSDRKISTSYIQRRLGIGYNKAAEIMDAFEVRGLVSAPQPGGSKRDILVFDEIENS